MYAKENEIQYYQIANPYEPLNDMFLFVVSYHI